jgi:hypothetical protein
LAIFEEPQPVNAMSSPFSWQLSAYPTENPYFALCFVFFFIHFWGRYYECLLATHLFSSRTFADFLGMPVF